MHRAKKTVLATLLALSASMPVPTVSSPAGTNISCIAQKINNTVDTILNNLCPSTRQPVASPCAPRSISTPTTITAPGAYCLATAINGHIAIQSDNVTLDLSGRSISNGISITGDRIAVHNGIVAAPGAAAISATNCTALTIQNITAKNSLIGALLSSVQDADISFCTFSTNTTGLEINASSAIRVHDCSACDNDLAGFSLMNAESNCFQRCTALNNGSQSPTDGFGFVSTNGSANMFTNCTADATQTATTNFCNVAAGFALLGTEQCSKIVDCSACNAFGPFEAEPLGSQTHIKSARPHGIYLEPLITSTTLPKLTTGFIPTKGQINSTNWSPDGKHLAVSGNDNNSGNQLLNIYQFNYNQSPYLTLLTSIPASLGFIYSVNWSADGQYIAAGGINGTNNEVLNIYLFDIHSSPILSPISTGLIASSGTISSVNWSPNDTYIATGGNNNSNNGTLKVYQFDPTSLPVLTPIFVLNPPFSNQINTVDWSPDGTYLAIGGTRSAFSNIFLTIYKFDRSASPVLTPLLTLMSPPAGEIFSVNWSPDGKYLATGGTNFASQTLTIYQFNPNTSAVIEPISSIEIPQGLIFSIDWSDDNKYLATGTSNGATQVYLFDPSSSDILTLVSSALNPTQGFIFSVNWSPDGAHIAVGGKDAANEKTLNIYNALQFPTKNFIQNNITTCNMTTSTQCPRGTGISGSSIANCIIGNTSYNNPFNYTFVTNTFSQLLAGNFSPSRLQNVDLIACDPICTPANLADLMNCLLEKNTFNQSLLEQILFKINN